MSNSPFRRMVWLALIILFLVVAPACEKRADVVAVMDVFFQWNPSGTSIHKSPEIRLSNIPESTHRFSVQLVDLDIKSFNHGGGTYPYNGSPIIPLGELDGDYQGPQAPPISPHRYEITVKALDAAGTVIGEGRKIRNFPEHD